MDTDKEDNNKDNFKIFSDKFVCQETAYRLPIANPKNRPQY